ncbi:Short chain fatty acid transporter, partial [Pseudomonas aeruginosa]
PFTETIFLWQSGVMLLALILVSLVIAYMTAPSAASARDAKDCGVDVSFTAPARLAPTRPGEWLEHSPLLIILLVLLAGGWLVHEFSTKPAILAISGLNTYNLLFLMLGALLHWRPRSFLDAVARAVPTTTGVLIQFPLYGSIAAIMTTVNGSDGETLAHHISTFFVQIASHDTYALLMGVYSAVLGFFIPSGGGKWIIEAPYVMQVANELQYHLGWAVQIYNAAEALPNLINPFYMLPLLGVLGLKARDLIGFSFVQLLVHIPLVLVLLWALGSTLAYIPPVMP